MKLGYYMRRFLDLIWVFKFSRPEWIIDYMEAGSLSFSSEHCELLSVGF
jgi:hypothetical protein